MKIFGFDLNKDMFEVDLSFKDIVTANIDPWRIDLFDPNPVRLQVGSRQLLFSRMLQLKFAYAPDGQHVLAGLYDGKIKSCFRAPVEDQSKVDIRKVDWCGDAFDLHLMEYLARSAAGATAVDPCKSWDSARHAHSSYAHFWIGDFRFDLDEWTGAIDPGTFAGTMFEMLPVRGKLDASLRWIFDELADWKPIVLGTAVRNSLSRTEVNEVEIQIDGNQRWIDGKDRLYVLGATKIVEHDARTNWSNFSSQLFSCRFRGLDVLIRKNSEGGKEAAEEAMKHTEFSIDQLFADAPDRIHASRICLYDMVKKQARLTSLFRPYGGLLPETQWRARASELKWDDWFVLPSHVVDVGCSVELGPSKLETRM